MGLYEVIYLGEGELPKGHNQSCVDLTNTSVDADYPTYRNTFSATVYEMDLKTLAKWLIANTSYHYMLYDDKIHLLSDGMQVAVYTGLNVESLQ